MALTCSDKCDQATSLHSSVQSMYASYYNGGTKIQAIVDCSTALTASINSLKIASVNGVNAQAGNTNKLATGGGMSCSLDNLLDVNSIFGKWADGVKALADGSWLDSTIADLQYLLDATRDAGTVQSRICGAASKTSGLITKISELLAALDAFPSSLNDIAAKLGGLAVNINCDKIMSKMASLRPTLGTANPAAAQGYDALQEAKTALGAGASKGDITALAQERLIANSGAETTMSNVGSTIDSKITALNT